MGHKKRRLSALPDESNLKAIWFTIFEILENGASFNDAHQKGMSRECQEKSGNFRGCFVLCLLIGTQE
jgi:hypothetical protein